MLQPTRSNAGVQAWYYRQLDKLVDEMQESTLYWIAAKYRQVEAANDAAPSAKGAPVSFLKRALNRLRERWVTRYDKVSGELAERFAGRAIRHSDTSLYNALERAGLTVKMVMTKNMQSALDAVVAENVSLIRSIPMQHFTQVETLVMQATQRGFDVGHLATELRERLGVERRRAALIARDQTNKAHAVLTAQRQKDIGITHGVWQHSHAGKVPRPSHVAANGKEFDLDIGLYLDGKWVLPGQAINCRCTWRAVLPGWD